METAPDPLTCFEKLAQQGCQTVALEYSSLVRDDLCAGPISAVRRSDVRDPGTGGQQTHIPIVPISKLELFSLDDIQPLFLFLFLSISDSQVLREIEPHTDKGHHLKAPSEAEVEEIGKGFERLSKHSAFRRSVGAINGCHVGIRDPALGQCYYNRKLHPSIILQAVRDHNAMFLDIFVGFPGSVHDSRVLKNSHVYVSRSYPPPGLFILV
ncbi:hypothetical protein G5714_001502 [Onychostoma macrolepis]|uniref:DDE Tnp4 domain-containing protein n=1 Tax=Onychostoma macrolepis TaxID=369639 RepID=A0A7J6DCJ9_9TELE|nr:hypothetical protein G5714_001502 [Onychostoma macrolepis]